MIISKIFSLSQESLNKRVGSILLFEKIRLFSKRFVVFTKICETPKLFVEIEIN
jgi:hypothetical protein